MQQWVGCRKHPVVGGRDIVRADRLERNLNGLRVLDGFAAGALQTGTAPRVGYRRGQSRLRRCGRSVGIIIEIVLFSMRLRLPILM